MDRVAPTNSQIERRKANSSSRAYASPPPSPGSSSATTPLPLRRSISRLTQAQAASTFPPHPPLRAPLPSRTAHIAPHGGCTINRIVAASAQLASIVQTPFLTLCDASMGYHLPVCLRVVEAVGVVEVLCEGPSTGVHVKEIARRTGLDASKLGAYAFLVLLVVPTSVPIVPITPTSSASSQHTSFSARFAPDVFAANRISSLLDSGKSVDELVRKVFFWPLIFVLGVPFFATLFLLRVVLHDCPDAFAKRILLRLREAAAPDTRLVLADFVLCVDDFWVGGGGVGANVGEKAETEKEKEPQVEGAEKMLAPAPLLANLGKASANACKVTFNGQERTLRETVTVAPALSARWKVVRVTKARPARSSGIFGSVFFDMPFGSGAGESSSSYGAHGVSANRSVSRREVEMVEQASSRCGTPTFGSRVDLPSMAEARGAAVVPGALEAGGGVDYAANAQDEALAAVCGAPAVVTLSFAQLQSSLIARRRGQAPLFRLQQHQQQAQPLAPSPLPQQALPPPLLTSPHLSLRRWTSYAHLEQTVQLQGRGHMAIVTLRASQDTPPSSARPRARTLRHIPSSPVLK
ncbi:hypothetical protein B0H16DRAFT_1734826 [Mycena metata]|uniref:Uncharacterized protein n=1 Tax=Mycena metata TaxID=1033252 RepID=A0AAD7MRX7_9AGAR|nr:hypothetical protein B0H16DRAFT_1734826 [Mycena metata]